MTSSTGSSTADSTSGMKGRIFVQYKQNDTVTDFGAYLQSSATEGHRFVQLDGTGLASKARIRNNDVIVSMFRASLEVKAVPHEALLEWFRNAGPTNTLLIRRGDKNGQNCKYVWIAFRVGLSSHWRPKHKIPVITARFKQLVLMDGCILPPDPDNLPDWATPRYEQTLYRYRRTERVRVSATYRGRDMYLGIYFMNSFGGVLAGVFRPNEFVLNMHLYQDIGSSDGEQAVSFSGIPLAESASSGTHISDECYDDDDGDYCDDEDGDDDDNDGQNEGDEDGDDVAAVDDAEGDVCGDDDDDTAEQCIAGNSIGNVQVLDFPEYMTDPTADIPTNERLFYVNLQANGAVEIKAADTRDALYLWYRASVQFGQAVLQTRESTLTLTPVTQEATV